MSIISLRVVTWTIPLCLSTASMISGVPASDPVWASMACRAFSERPTLRATMGLPRVARAGRHPPELLRLLEALDDDADHLGVAVVDEEFQVVLDGDPGLVAAGDDVAEADRALLASGARPRRG